jgi:hypothetical protein
MPANTNTPSIACRYGAFYLIGRVLMGLWPVVVQSLLRLTPALLVYLTGLVTQDNITATDISAQVGVVAHDDLTRLLRTVCGGLSFGACLAVRLLSALGGQGWLIIDDVLIPKPFARAIAFCAWDHDHSLHRHVFGMRLVFVVWSNGFVLIPLLFAIWQKDPTRKPPKKRRKRTRSGGPNGGELLLVVIKDDRSHKGGCTKYLLTDDLSLTTRQVVEWYRRRWAIEVFFRDCKQLLRMGECEARSKEAIVGHIFLVCVAYTLMQLFKPAGKKQRRSVCAIKDEMTTLVMLPKKRSGLQAHRHNPSGELSKVDVEHFLDPIRTRLPQLTIPKLLTFSLSLRS